VTKKFRAHVKSVLESIISNEQSLTQMDAAVGDGDLGIGATRSGKLVLAIINNLDFQNNLSGSVMKMSDVWSDGFGGSSGPLWGSFFSRAAAKLSTKLAENTKETWMAAYQEGVKAMMECGGAQPGDRTMIDALHEGSEALKASPDSYGALSEAVRSGADKAA